MPHFELLTMNGTGEKRVAFVVNRTGWVTAVHGKGVVYFNRKPQHRAMNSRSERFDAHRVLRAFEEKSPVCTRPFCEFALRTIQLHVALEGIAVLS